MVDNNQKSIENGDSSAKLASAVQAISTTLSTKLGSTSLERSLANATPDQFFWPAIRNRTSAIGFTQYKAFIDSIFCKADGDPVGFRLISSIKQPPNTQISADWLRGSLIDQGYDVSSMEYIAENNGIAKLMLDDVVHYQAKIVNGVAKFYRKLSLAEGSLVPVEDAIGKLHGLNAYELLKTATEVFLLLNCGIKIENAGFDLTEESGRIKNHNEEISLSVLSKKLNDYLGTGKTLPYLERIVDALETSQVSSPFCDGILLSNLSCPCLLELIWSYWHEEGMLVQAINAVSLRFQNKRRAGGKDPLANLEIDPLRSLGAFLWGYIQDEKDRLTVKRRAYEYDHHYGITLFGQAVGSLHPADSRSKFLEGFHSLMRMTAGYYRDASDTTIVPDGFPLLNAIKEVHLELAAGAHNQFRDLPWTARVEMLIQQWLLARPEMKDFLAGRAMVPYPEAWMGQVDSMNKLQGWTDTTVRHFRDLAVFGERILLSIRYGDWSEITDENRARNWADYWKQEVQGYIHAYRAATGIDLTADVPDAPTLQRINTQPSIHLRNRLNGQKVARTR